jgi:hypothetical protein
VCKAIFNRPKDWLDIEQMLVCVDELDMDEIRGWLDRIVGADDPRRERFRASDGDLGDVTQLAPRSFRSGVKAGDRLYGELAVDGLQISEVLPILWAARKTLEADDAG